MDKQDERSGLLARMRQAAEAWYAKEPGERDEQKLAEAVGAGRGAVWAWLTMEGKQSVPRADQLARFAKVTGYSGHWLLTGEGDPLVPPGEPNAFNRGVARTTEAMMKAVREERLRAGLDMPEEEWREEAPRHPSHNNSDGAAGGA